MNLITVVIPVFNRSLALRRCLNSLTCQTFSNFEVTVVDDGSTEDIRLVCSHFTESLQITYFKIPNSGSPSVPRNFGATKASTNWLIFLDSDDYFLPSALESFVNQLCLKSNLDVYHCSVYDKYSSELFLNTNHYIRFSFREVIARGNKISLSSLVLRRSAFMNTAGFQASIFSGLKRLRWEDYHLTISLSKSNLVYYFNASPQVVIDKDDSYGNRLNRLRTGLIHFRSKVHKHSLPFWYYKSLFIRVLERTSLIYAVILFLKILPRLLCAFIQVSFYSLRAFCVSRLHISIYHSSQIIKTH